MQEKKLSLLQSKTFWLAVAQGLLGVVIVVINYYPEAGELIILKSFIDIALRLMTSGTISTFSDKPKK